MLDRIGEATVAVVLRDCDSRVDVECDEAGGRVLGPEKRTAGSRLVATVDEDGRMEARAAKSLPELREAVVAADSRIDHELTIVVGDGDL
jgi:hypothetical protein